MSACTERQLIDFVYAEARLLDEQRYDDWLALFGDDGHYWMPLTPGQQDPRLETSLLYEDKLLLRIRTERLRGRRTYSQQPPSRCHHLLQQPSVEFADDADGRYTLRTAFHYLETRLDRQALYAGWTRHELKLLDGALRIQLKRVDLVNSDAAFGNIDLFM
jgi:3-phenylpropionate/cinnamic acid dioxygenase small subunit